MVQYADDTTFCFTAESQSILEVQTYTWVPHLMADNLKTNKILFKNPGTIIIRNNKFVRWICFQKDGS